MQIKTGTAAVTNGSNTVIASAGVDWSGVTTMCSFSLDGVRGAPVYGITAIAFVGGHWQLTLASPYGQTTNAAAAYVIQKDFHTLTVDGEDFHVPIYSAGDTQTLEIENRARLEMVSAMSALAARPAAPTRLTSIAALEAFDPTPLTFGDLIFVTSNDMTSIYEYQNGVPAAGDHYVSGSTTTRYRQTGGS
jgi:hypothetical protein